MMKDDKIQAAISSKVVCLVKWIMQQLGVSEDAAYEKLLGTDLYRLMTDGETGLFLESIEYIYECYRIETECGKEQLLQYINIV